MMNSVIEISVIAIVAISLSLMLKRDRPEFSLLISVGAGVIIIANVFPVMGNALALILDISDISGINSEYIVLIIKSCVIAMITGTVAATCRDCGFSSIALKMEIAGRITIIILALPVINTLFNTILSVIK